MVGLLESHASAYGNVLYGLRLKPRAIRLRAGFPGRVFYPGLTVGLLAGSAPAVQSYIMVASSILVSPF